MRIIKEERELKSAIGQGYAYIYKDKHGMDSLSVFKKTLMKFIVWTLFQIGKNIKIKTVF